ncbi:MAG: hypothetical protein U0136_10975 [Bdellovibrionota bacterium]
MKYNQPSLAYRAFSVVAVTAYLSSVLALLLYKKRIHPPFSFKKIIRAKFQPPYAGAIAAAQMTPEIGNCYTAPLPANLISDSEGCSKLQLLEDGKPLPGAHAVHADIRTQGKGMFSHWGACIFFSASDNSDPRTNGRQYTVKEVR